MLIIGDPVFQYFIKTTHQFPGSLSHVNNINVIWPEFRQLHKEVAPYCITLDRTTRIA